MSLLDSFDDLAKRQDLGMLETYRLENLYVKSIFRKGGVCCFSVANKVSLASELKSIIKSSYYSQELKGMASRGIHAIDCRNVCKGDAYGFLSKVAEDKTNPIVVIENVTQIPGEDAVHDNPDYVANLLLHSWKNEDIIVGDIHINRREITVILTCPVEEEEVLKKVCALNSYAWCGDFDEWKNIRKNMASSWAEKEYEENGISNLAKEFADRNAL